MIDAVHKEVAEHPGSTVVHVEDGYTVQYPDGGSKDFRFPLPISRDLPPHVWDAVATGYARQTLAEHLTRGINPLAEVPEKKTP